MELATTKQINNADIKHEIKELMHIPGRHLFSIYNTVSKKAIEFEKRIEKHIAGPRGIGHREYYEELIAEFKRLFLKRELLINNIVVTAGRGVIAQRLANDTTYTGIINYGILASGSTTPANGDTIVDTEVFRKVVASQSITDATAFIDFFYSKADTNGTYNSFGTVIDGTASADTGQLFTNALTGGWTKTASESMTVACQYDIT